MRVDTLSEAMVYSVLYADPPWEYRDRQHSGKRGKETGGAKKHYSTMSRADLQALNVSKICSKDAILFLWTSSPCLGQSIALIEAWGFVYKTVAFVWDKQRVNPGSYTMSQCELCLVATRKGGKIPQPRGARNIRQFISEMRREHSQKPTQVRDRIARMFPHQNKIELFARDHVNGWDVWGNEAPHCPE